MVNSSISGLFINHPWAGKCILVNYDEDLYRQNFTIAHEVAHAIFDYREDINISYKDEKFDMKLDMKEVRANTFASNFLIPKSELRKLPIINWQQEHVLKLARQLRVNIQPLLIALKEAKLISESHAKEFKSLKLSRGEKEDPELNNLSTKGRIAISTLLEKGLSYHYVKNCFESYTKGEVTANRLADMLLSNEDELKEILSLYNLKLTYEY